MSQESYIASLKEKHKELDEQIAEAERHNLLDNPELKSLKQKKLRLKEEISKLCSEAPSGSSPETI